MLGTCCVVLHTHLPWLAHAGAWPVGEEWLHQAWATSYDPVTELLERLAAEGRRDVLTLGVTPVLAAMLWSIDDNMITISTPASASEYLSCASTRSMIVSGRGPSSLIDPARRYSTVFK